MKQMDNIHESEASADYIQKASFEHTSKYRGVSWRKDRKCWRAVIYSNGIKFNLGNFDDEFDAAIAYIEKAEKIFNPLLISAGYQTIDVDKYLETGTWNGYQVARRKGWMSKQKSISQSNGIWVVKLGNGFLGYGNRLTRNPVMAMQWPSKEEAESENDWSGEVSQFKEVSQ